jgi:hypothetical protein
MHSDTCVLLNSTILHTINAAEYVCIKRIYQTMLVIGRCGDVSLQRHSGSEAMLMACRYMCESDAVMLYDMTHRSTIRN